MTDRLKTVYPPKLRLRGVQIGRGQPRFIIYINFVELESLMLHPKFQDHRTSGSGRIFTISLAR